MTLLDLDPTSKDALRTAGRTGEPMEVSHQLRSHDLLTLPALADLAAALPESSVEHNVGALPHVLAGGNAPKLDLSVHDLVTGIEDNGAWVVLKNVEQDVRYSRLLDSCLDEIEELVSGPGQAFGREGFIFLSAPNSVTPTHIDHEHNVLLQVYGTKIMVTGRWESPQARQSEAERLLSGGHRNLASPAVDETPHHLDPGMGIYVPPYTPHTVLNGPGLSISLSVTWRTRALKDEADLHELNARLRKAGLSPQAPGARNGRDRLKLGALSGYSKLKAVGAAVRSR
ncbi:hypothetical protein TEK04_15885 [Klenkia sp. LSe6-5]|uniref:JmjC domain-containing protein n=1 Tax=Klenkia sesuvii TaxID=3103137 RepID=A0ABU8DWJ0_9ACTN